MSSGESDAPKDPAFARRLFNAFKDLERSEGGKINQAEFGRRVSANYRRGSVYGQSAVSKWLAGTRPEDPVIRAMAVTLGCDEGWLLNGESGATTIPRKRRKGPKTQPEPFERRIDDAPEKRRSRRRTG